MKIQIGQVYLDAVTNEKIPYPNKTKKYLLPCFKDYGEEFVKKINNVFKVAVGIGDIIVKNRGISYEKHIFVLIDINIAHSFFCDFLYWIREQPMYENDYTFGDLRKSTYHMIVIKLPEKYYETFHMFKEGKYSKMFDRETLHKFFDTYPSIKKVLLKDHNYNIHFVPKFNEKYNLNIPIESWQGELDFPPTEVGEVFNHHIKH